MEFMILILISVTPFSVKFNSSITITHKPVCSEYRTPRKPSTRPARNSLPFPFPEHHHSETLLRRSRGIRSMRDLFVRS